MPQLGSYSPAQNSGGCDSTAAEIVGADMTSTLRKALWAVFFSSVASLMHMGTAAMAQDMGRNPDGVWRPRGGGGGEPYTRSGRGEGRRDGMGRGGEGFGGRGGGGRGGGVEGGSVRDDAEDDQGGGPGGGGK